MPSLITDRGMCLLRAMLAQVWRATYIDRGAASPAVVPIALRFLLILCLPVHIAGVLRKGR